MSSGLGRTPRILVATQCPRAHVVRGLDGQRPSLQTLEPPFLPMRRSLEGLWSLVVRWGSGMDVEWLDSGTWPSVLGKDHLAPWGSRVLICKVGAIRVPPSRDVGEAKVP